MMMTKVLRTTFTNCVIILGAVGDNPIVIAGPETLQVSLSEPNALKQPSLLELKRHVSQHFPVFFVIYIQSILIIHMLRM